MTSSCEKAARLAHRWVRIALESAQGEGGSHPGVVAHLTAARAQLEAVEKLLAPAGPQGTERGTTTEEPLGVARGGAGADREQPVATARMREVEEHDLLDRIADKDPQARVIGWQSGRGPVVRRADGRPQALEPEHIQPPPLAPPTDDHEHTTAAAG
jgi:hypothetical protein